MLWTRWPEKKLLSTRIRDLPLDLSGPLIERGIGQLRQEISSHFTYFHPTIYLSDEWQSPEGEVAIGIPFSSATGGYGP